MKSIPAAFFLPRIARRPSRFLHRIACVMKMARSRAIPFRLPRIACVMKMAGLPAIPTALALALAFAPSARAATVMPTLGAVSNLVAQAVENALSRVAAAALANDAETLADRATALYSTTNGDSVASLPVQRVENGVAVVSAVTCTVHVAVTAADCCGAIVTASSLAAFPTGLVFAADSSGVLHAATNAAGGAGASPPSVASWRTFTETNSIAATSNAAARTEIAWAMAPEDWANPATNWLSIARGDYLTAVTYFLGTNGTDKIPFGSFTLEPRRFTLAELTAAGLADYACTNAPGFASAAPAVPRSATLTVTAASSSASSASSSSASASASSASASSSIVIPVRSTPKVPMGGTWENGEDYIWSRNVWWLESEWNEPENWIDFPVVVLIPDGYNADGSVCYYELKCRRLSQLLAVAGDSFPALPPSSYVAPFKIETPQCAKLGHAWHQCVCTKCGKTREHAFDAVAANSAVCASCKNLDTRWVYSDGAYHCVETETPCGLSYAEILPESTVYHGGWHDGGGDSSSALSCACKCGKYAANALQLAHALVDYDPARYNSTGDPSTHEHVKYCSRCFACGNTSTRTLVEEHKIDESKSYNYSPAGDNDVHDAQGDCSLCQQSGLQFQQRHFFNTEGSCVCSGCGETHHSWEATGGSSAYDDCDNEKCTRCGDFAGTQQHVYTLTFLGAEWQTTLSDGETPAHYCNCKANAGTSLAAVEACTSFSCRNPTTGKWGYWCLHCGRNMDSDGRTWDSDPDGSDPYCPWGNPLGLHSWDPTNGKDPNNPTGGGRTTIPPTCSGCGKNHPTRYETNGYAITGIKRMEDGGGQWEVVDMTLEPLEDGTYKRTFKYELGLRLMWMPDPNNSSTINHEDYYFYCEETDYFSM